MNGYTHMVVGGMTAGLIASAAIARKTLGFEINEHQIYPLVMIIPAIMGGLAPDMDMPNSKAGKTIRTALTWAIICSFITMGGMAIVAFFGDITWSSIAPVGIFFLASCVLITLVNLAKHRRETHSLLICLIILIPMVWVIVAYEPKLSTNLLLSAWGGLWVGWVSHLIADTFNGKGVPWLFPLKTSKNGSKYTYFHIMSIRTGTSEETVFRYVTIVSMIVAYSVIIVALGGGINEAL